MLSRDATRKLAWPAAPAGLVFLDPPWRKHDDDDDLAALAISNLISIGAIENGGIISIEHDHRRPPEPAKILNYWKHAAGANRRSIPLYPLTAGKQAFNFSKRQGDPCRPAVITLT